MWTFDQADQLNLDQRIVNNFMRRGWYSTLKDYFEYTILYQEGGIFLDYDTMCVKPLDELAYRYRFFGHLEPWSMLNEEA